MSLGFRTETRQGRGRPVSAELRRTVPVTMNEPAIERLVREGAGPAEPRPGGAGSARTRP